MADRRDKVREMRERGDRREKGGGGRRKNTHSQEENEGWWEKVHSREEVS